MEIFKPSTLKGYVLFGAIQGFIINLLSGLSEIYIDNNGFGGFWVITALPAIVIGGVLFAVIYILPITRKILIPLTAILYIVAVSLTLRSSFIF